MANCSHPDYRVWVYVIGGFRQTAGRPNGSVRLHDDLDREFSQPGRVRIEFRRWSGDWWDVAEHAWCLRPHGDPDRTKVIICGYSWGGASAAILAREFQKRGITVHSLILADAVYRHWYFLGWWRAFFKWSKITIPANVRNVHWFRQDRNWPQGHDVVAEDSSKTRLTRPILAYQYHEYMDDLLYYHHQARDSIKQCLKEIDIENTRSEAVT